MHISLNWGRKNGRTQRKKHVAWKRTTQQTTQFTCAEPEPRRWKVIALTTPSTMPPSIMNILWVRILKGAWKFPNGIWPNKEHRMILAVKEKRLFSERDEVIFEFCAIPHPLFPVPHLSHNSNSLKKGKWHPVSAHLELRHCFDRFYSGLESSFVYYYFNY